MFRILLRDIASPQHAMVKLIGTVGLQSFEDRLLANFCANNGRSSYPARLKPTLHYPKYASGMNDEAVFDEWLENHY